MLERVDVVTGGASAVYGADAVSGVVNFILKRDFEGVDISSTYGTSEEGDADQQRIDLVIGANTPDGRGNVTLGVGYTNRDELRQGERDIGEVSLSSVTGAPGGSSASVPTVTTRPFAQFNPATGAFDIEDVALFNFNPLNLFVAPLERTQITALGHYEINRHAEVYSQLFFTDSFVAQNLAPSGTFFSNWDISVAHPFLPDAARADLCARSLTPITDCSATSDETITGVQLRRRFVEFGPRLGNFDNSTFQYTVGLRGDVTDSMDYDVFWTRGEADQTRTLGNWGSSTKVQQALLADATGCLDPTNGCTPLNLFGPAGSITDDQIAFINLSALQKQLVVQENGGVAFSGDFGDFTLPTSGLGIGYAFGVEHRRVKGATQSDAASQTQNEILGTGAPTPDRSGRFKLDEAFGEILVPIAEGLPGIHSLSFEGGLRYTDFSVTDGGSDSYTTWKAGISYEPIESLRVRTMLQRATRAPNVNELFQPVVTGLDNLAIDPCAEDAIDPADANTPGTLANLCLQTGVPLAVMGGLDQPAAGQINVLVGGNPELGPEEADTITAGLVWSPTFIDRLTLTLDYYDIDITDAITEPSSGDIIDGCYSTELNPNREFNVFCQAIGRSPTGGDLNADDADGVSLPTSNLGKLRTTGWDMSATYGMDLPSNFGGLTFGANINYVTKWDFQATPTSINRDCIGYYSVNCGAGIPELKGNVRTTWSVSDFDVSLLYRYIDGMEVEPLAAESVGGFLPAFSSIGSYSYWDLTGAWQVLDNVRLTLIVNNLFDRDPPVVGNDIGTTATNSGNTFPQTYDVIGRYYTLGLNVKF
jgi:outer membrane receptor protein involved in Fe transport